MAEETPAPPEQPDQPEQPRSRSLSPTVLTAVAVAALVLILVGAYVLGAINHRPVSSAQRGVLVGGKGSVTATPDQLTFDVTVEHRAPDVATAMDQSNADTRKVLDALAAHGIDKADIATEEVTVEPTYDYKSEGEKITGYAATQRLSVKVRRLDTAGEVISAAASAAGNAARIGNVAMSVADKSDLQADARAKAVRDARRKAQQYADAAGRDLGKVLVVEEESASAPPVPANADMASAASDGAAPTPISAGTQKISVRVSVRFAFE